MRIVNSGPRRRHGFSLIELLVVIAIIGILATLAIPNLIRAQYKARAIKIINDLRTIKDVTINYYTDTGKWPETSGFGRRPEEIKSDLPPALSFNLDAWKIRYYYANYSRWIDYGSKAWQNWLQNGGFAVGIIVYSQNTLLTKTLVRTSPQMFGRTITFPGFGGYLYFAIQ